MYKNKTKWKSKFTEQWVGGKY